MNVTGNKATIVYVRKSYVHIDDEGSKTKEYFSPTLLKGILVPVSGQATIAMYGEQTKYMLEMYVLPETILSELDGLCINVSADKAPDYEVVAIFDYKKVKQLLLRKRAVNG